MRVKVRGHIYQDVVEAALDLGVTKAAVYSAVARGTQDQLGLYVNGASGGKKPIPFKIGRITFASKREASRALGKNDTYIQLVLDRGGPKAKENLTRLMLEYNQRIDNIYKKGNDQ